MSEDEQITADFQRVHVTLQIALDAAEDEARQLAVAYPEASVGRRVFREIADDLSELADRMVRRP